MNKMDCGKDDHNINSNYFGNDVNTLGQSYDTAHQNNHKIIRYTGWIVARMIIVKENHRIQHTRIIIRPGDTQDGFWLG